LPSLREYLVWPAKSPLNIRPLYEHFNNLPPGQTWIDFNARPFSGVEYKILVEIIIDIGQKLNPFFQHIFNATLGCSQAIEEKEPWKCIRFYWQTPVARALGERKTWVRFSRKLPAGFMLFPLPVEVFIDHSGADPAAPRPHLTAINGTGWTRSTSGRS